MSFTERLHPRAHDGKFATGGTGGGGVRVRSRRRGADEVVEHRAPARGGPAGADTPAASGGAAWTSKGGAHVGQIGGSQYHLKRAGGVWSVYHGHPDDKRKVATAGNVAEARGKAEDHARQTRTPARIPTNPGDPAQQADANARGLLRTRDPHGTIRGAHDDLLAPLQASLKKIMTDPGTLDSHRTKAGNLHQAVIDERVSRGIAARPEGGTPAVGSKHVGVRAGDLERGHMIVHPDGKIHEVVAATPLPGGKTRVHTKTDQFEIGSNEKVPTLPKGPTGKRDPSETVKTGSRGGFTGSVFAKPDKQHTPGLEGRNTGPVGTEAGWAEHSGGESTRRIGGQVYTIKAKGGQYQVTAAGGKHVGFGRTPAQARKLAEAHAGRGGR